MPFKWGSKNSRKTDDTQAPPANTNETNESIRYSSESEDLKAAVAEVGAAKAEEKKKAREESRRDFFSSLGSGGAPGFRA
ncbi:hypothetical protein ABW19_dt0207241 [Dactylella cylindrospora]|nr:hypothetical protein ABW19_dt0207241 [Dactylella cylindrospora]